MKSIHIIWYRNLEIGEHSSFLIIDEIGFGIDFKKYQIGTINYTN